jgi:hypothetical protein
MVISTGLAENNAYLGMRCEDEKKGAEAPFKGGSSNRYETLIHEFIGALSTPSEPTDSG